MAKKAHMKKQKLRGNDLKRINYQDNRIRSIAIDVMAKYYKHTSLDEQLVLLSDVLQNPETYRDHIYLAPIAIELLDEEEIEEKSEISLLEEPLDFKIFGKKLITPQAISQMELAMQLPIARKGALMPDAHQGYGLPIGGVLATKDAVIPYGVGIDIGCRMSLSIFDVSADYLDKNAFKFKASLYENTFFGAKETRFKSQTHEVLDDSRFQETGLLRQLHGRAVRQLGTSGSGNHFVEFGIVHLSEGNEFGLPEGAYLGLLSHSGSRGLGAYVAKHYTEIAMEQCLLPSHAQHFAWLDLNTEEGQEYWLSMNLAGDYAKACHDQVHFHLCKDLGLSPIARIENHHNFAWKKHFEDVGEVIVHRKGATPAAAGELGIIPGSMANNGYIVKGTGNVDSMDSASHGAGRRMSRKRTKESYTGSEMKKVLKKNNVTLIGGGIDEAPIAYKDIEEVMDSQKALVEVVGKFEPRIVKMDKH